MSMNRATPSAKKFNRDKPTVGQHPECTVLDVRLNKGYKGLGFFIDYRIDEGVDAGKEFAYKVYPDSATGGGQLSREQAVDKEWGKVQQAIAACFGFEQKDQAVVTEDVYQTVIATRRALGTKSPLAGRRLRIHQVGHVNKAGGETSFTDVYPHPVEIAKAVKPTAAPVEVAPAIPSLPVAAAVFPPAPWAYHPQSADYVMNAAYNPPVITVGQLRDLITQGKVAA